MARAFVIRPFNVKKDSAGNPLDFERTHEELIAPAIKACKLDGSTTGEIVEPGNIREDMFALIIEADIVICDITIHNANVFYELGIRHALRKRRTVLISGTPTADSTPFDILTDRYVPYPIAKPSEALRKLIEAITAALATERETDSPIFKMLPGLPEADPKRIQAVPLGFREEIERACAAQSKGWLRLLAHDVRGLRFQRTGLQLVADAMWSLGDYEAARDVLEEIRGVVPDDDAANVALGTIYERLYRKQKDPKLLASSDQALERVLESRTSSSKSRVEALALKGRNGKTRWREQFEPIVDVAERRSAAMTEALRDSYAAYRDAFQQDLNHFYSGIAALQMGVCFLELSSESDPGWKDSFESNARAVTYRQQVEDEVGALRAVVGASADAALNRSSSDDDRVWAKVTKCDLLFLANEEAGARRIARQYKDAMPPDKPFVWSAARGQLELFASLGIRADLARAVVAAVDTGMPRATAASDKPLNMVVFAGHRVDEPARATPRFPPALESRALELILERLREFAETHRVVGLASAAPGGDIVFHEACDRLGIETTVCLPMREQDYVQSVFDDLMWRGRFVRLMAERKRSRPPAVLELSDTAGLPAWLHGSSTNTWERGNRWVLEMALTSGAKKVTLLALWDGLLEGDAPGGTAHMVSLSRATTGVEIVHLPIQALTATAV